MARNSYACPACSGPVKRVHRRFVDHLIAALTLLPLRRYRCQDERCTWSGVLKHEYSQSRRAPV